MRSVLPALAVVAFATPGARAEDERCLDYSKGKKLGSIDADRVREASGLAASELQPGVLWVHNDSGADTWLYAMSEDGDDLGRWKVEGADAVDWEDLALGPCGDGERACLYIADTGNNVGDREDQTIYRVPEPLIDGDGEPVTAEAMQVTLPEGVDVEALFLDAQGALYLVSKDDKRATLYRVGPFEDGATAEAEELAVRKDIEFVTGATTNADATRIVLRSNERAWELFRPKGRSTRSAFLGEALEIDLDHEGQGEAVALTWDGEGFYTTREGKGAPIRWYRCKDLGATLTGKEDSGGIIRDPAEPATEGCATGPTSSLAALALLIAARRRARAR